MQITHKKKNTNLFFDSFKHFKHNLSNLIGIELPTLCKLGAAKYLSLILTNYKSKFPDMRKIGLIDYKNPSDNQFELTEEGNFFINALTGQSYNEYALKSGRKNIDSIKPQHIISCFKKDLNTYKYEILKLILYYYYPADSLRPYLALLNFIRHYKITILDFDTLKNILSHSKENILLFKYNKNAFEMLDKTTQTELTRPISYIYNFLQTALILDFNRNVIVDFKLVDKLKNKMEHIVLKEPSVKDNNSRPAKEQRIFRENVLKAYGYKCAITKKSIFLANRPLLEAAHIIPYKDGGSFAVNNGIALSYEMHKMFDRGLFAFMYDGQSVKIKISESKHIIDNDGILKGLQNRIINLPTNRKDFPDELALSYNLQKYLLK